MAHDTVLILDFGAQYSQLIARRVRELGVYSEVVPYDISLPELESRRPKALILSGGPASVYAEGAPQAAPGLFDLGVPILGICYGLQAMSRTLGGQVAPAAKREYGRADVHVDEAGGLFEGIGRSGEALPCWMSHGDKVIRLPEGFTVLAHTGNAEVAAAGDLRRKLFGVQFHPEVIHTPWGKDFLANFALRVAGARPDWSMEGFVEEAVQAIRRQVGGARALCGLSGGIDSAVAAVLTHRAIGDKLTCVFVDHGLLRKGEAQQVVATFRDTFGMRLIHVDASGRFLRRLRGVTDPERKRRIIGEEFIRTFEAEAEQAGGFEFLVQGTIYPDVIESGTKTAATIKTHHNVGGLPADMRFELVEPLRMLFKDEVRLLAAELGLPRNSVTRHPFPGPGLAIRTLGPVTKAKLETVREADAIVVEEVTAAGLYERIWQCFAVLTGSRSVGVMGDERSYLYTVAVRAVVSDDAMTADWARLPAEVLDTIARRIVNEVKGVGRVVYDITAKPPATIEWE